MCDHLDLIAVNLIFDQVNATSVIVGENTKRLSFHEFLGALGSLALAMYDEIAVDQFADSEVALGLVRSNSTVSNDGSLGLGGSGGLGGLGGLVGLVGLVGGGGGSGGVDGGGGGSGEVDSPRGRSRSPRGEARRGVDVSFDVLAAEPSGASVASLAVSGRRTPGGGLRNNNLRNSLFQQTTDGRIEPAGGAGPPSPKAPRSSSAWLPSPGPGAAPAQGGLSPRHLGGRKTMMVGFKGSLRGAGDTITAADAVAQMVEECILPRAAQVPAGGAAPHSSVSFGLERSDWSKSFDSIPNPTRPDTEVKCDNSSGFRDKLLVVKMARNSHVWPSAQATPSAKSSPRPGRWRR